MTIASACRDSASRIETFRALVNGLDWPADDLRIVVCEGDSVDDTRARLYAWAEQDARLRVTVCDTGAPRYGSVVNAARFRNLARVFNAALDAVDLAWSDAVLFAPFDIDYAPSLLRRLAGHGVDMVSPLTWMGNIFYDTWALTQNGVNWCNFTRAWADEHLGDRLIEMTTVGGTVLIDAAILRAGCRYTEAEVDQGLSKCARAHGYQLWADTGMHVYHPQH